VAHTRPEQDAEQAGYGEGTILRNTPQQLTLTQQHDANYSSATADPGDSTRGVFHPPLWQPAMGHSPPLPIFIS
jgi:hypothetical protein